MQRQAMRNGQGKNYTVSKIFIDSSCCCKRHKTKLITDMFQQEQPGIFLIFANIRKSIIF